MKLEIEDYGLITGGLYAHWFVGNVGDSHVFPDAELGDELAYQGFCSTAYVSETGGMVCNMTDFLGYKPGELVPPRELWQTLAADQREAVVRGLIEQLKSETK